MRWFYSLSCLYGLLSLAEGQSAQGLVNLVKRRLPAHVDDFSFQLAPGNHTPGLTNDQYTVKCDSGKVSVQGNSLSALSSGSEATSYSISPRFGLLYVGCTAT